MTSSVTEVIDNRTTVDHNVTPPHSCHGQFPCVVLHHSFNKNMEKTSGQVVSLNPDGQDMKQTKCRSTFHQQISVC